MNEFNSGGKDIRFIDSHYHDLFRLPDGACIQIDYPDETVVKKCTFIDEYHTKIGYNVFHICQFAEIMERNGASYQAEPEIMGDVAAWQVGRDRILALQTSDEGYDYTLLDKDFREVDGGQLHNPELSMLEARSEILESFNLGNSDLKAMVYDDVMEAADKVAMQAFPVQVKENASLEELAAMLDRFAENFDPYEYWDQVDDAEAYVAMIKDDLQAGKTDAYREYLNDAIKSAPDAPTKEVAKALLTELDKVPSAQPEKKMSVCEQLALMQEHSDTPKPHTKHKEPAR